MSEELKSCPFCGGEAEYEEHRNAVRFKSHRVGCIGGGCAAKPFVWEDSEEEAIAAWNARAE